MKKDKFCFSKNAIKIGLIFVVSFVAIYFYFSYINFNSPKTKAKEINDCPDYNVDGHVCSTPTKAEIYCYYDGRKITKTSSPYYINKDGCIKKNKISTNDQCIYSKKSSKYILIINAPNCITPTPTMVYICPNYLNCAWNPAMDSTKCGCCGYFYNKIKSRCMEPLGI